MPPAGPHIWYNSTRKESREGKKDRQNMRLRNVPRAREELTASPYVYEDPAAYRGKWQEEFPKKAPLHIEIGTGKGRFIMELAARNPGINYIGIEKYSSVLLRLLEKQQEAQLQNLLLIRGDAEVIETYFAPGEVSRIYLNFSDPWPKDRHARRRLPSREFLARYDHILARDGVIEFKTDQRPLFDFALEALDGSAFRAAAVTFDLHADPVMNEGNIMTEYEERFSAKGNKICKYILIRKEE